MGAGRRHDCDALTLGSRWSGHATHAMKRALRAAKRCCMAPDAAERRAAYRLPCRECARIGVAPRADAHPMAALYTIAYPVISKKDAEFIRAFRARHDQLRAQMIQPHFTLVFGCVKVPSADFIAHSGRIAGHASAIRFCCRYAMVSGSDKEEAAQVHLVPEEGYSAISRLHDKLYTGPLAAELALNIPYVPHITIGSLSTRKAAKELCDQLNEKGLDIRGSIAALTVGEVRQAVFINRFEFKMRI